MNKIAATGRLVADAEIRAVASGEQVCSFRLASDVGFGDRKTTNWFSCQVWGKRGESLVKMLRKGLKVTVFGTLTMREWQDSDGAKRLSPDIRVDDVDLGSRSDAAEQQDDGGQQRSAPQPSRAPQPRQSSYGQQSGGSGSLDDPEIPF